MRRGTSDRWRRLAIAMTASMGALVLSVTSYAQGVPPPPDVPVAAPPAEPPPPPAPPPPMVTYAPPAPAPAGDTDFDPDVRRWGIGYAGVSTVPTGAGSVTVPALGVRYWMNPGMGLDLALGIGWTGGSTDVGGMSTDKNSVFGVLVQGGVPLVLSAHRHVNFEVMPYLTLGYGRTSTGMSSTYNEVDFNGFRLDVGARAGFEVFFGFIGIPELALSATVGLQFEYLRNEQSANGADATDTTLSISTTVQNNPWDIFTGNISARYYF
jgi:hypothetical protein